MTNTILKLSLLLSSIGLMTSRFTLLLHEFVGHGLPTLIFGGKVTGFYLYLFGGGYLTTTLPSEITTFEKFIIMMGGIALEIVLAILLFKVSSIFKNNYLKIVATTSSLILVLHSLTYFILGTNYGYGDGLFIYSHWGPLLPLTLPLCCVLIFATGFLAGKTYDTFKYFLNGMQNPRNRVLCLVIAALFAGSFHAALTYGERAILHEEKTTIFYENIKTDLVVKNTEVPKPLPLRVPLIAALSITILFSFYKKSKETILQDKLNTSSSGSFIIVPVLLLFALSLVGSIKIFFK